MNRMDQFASLIRAQRTTLLDQWRRQVRELPAAQHLDTPTLTDHIPQLIDELIAAFRAQSTETIPELLEEGTPPAHGAQRLADGFDIEEVVAEYNILRGCLHDLAEAHDLDLQGRPFRILNRTLDGAIGAAVRTYAELQAKSVQQRREEYLAFVMHDLRTPLGAITLATELMTEVLGGPDADPRLRRVLTTLKRNVGHLAGLVTKVIAENANVEADSGHKLERRTFDLWSLVESLIHDLAPVADAAGTRLVNAVPDDQAAYADAGLLRRVFQNLVANAIEYTPGGTVTIGTDAPEADGTLPCWVRDDGAGMPEDRTRRVFDKHETDPEKSGGLGLGLAIVKTLVEAHGGTVAVQSELGVGTTFTLRLPPRS
ncbi:MAG: sensor histidine kinase [Myxococcales bacterium]|nr:sensor histidine kinase [Myxococcales bacterium]